jgi:hypothetical protein
MWRQGKAVVIDPKRIVAATLPRQCIWTNEPVKRLRPMTLQEQDWRTSGGVIRGTVTSFDIELPISDRWFEKRADLKRRVRKNLFIAGGIIVFVSIVAQLVNVFLAESGQIWPIAPIGIGGALVLIVAAIAFPHLKDFNTDPSVIHALLYGGRFHLSHAHPDFLMGLPEAPPVS